MSILRDKRALFTRLLSLLINKMIEDGRTPLIGKDGLKHMKGSLHYEGLAVDIDLFLDGEYLENTADHRVFGEFWEGLHMDCRWGGRFDDGNHYSVTYLGKA
jgi:hypothetical protein